MNDYPIRLKPDDAPPPPAPETVGYELADLARRLADETHHLAELIRSWGANPLDVQRLAHTRSLEIAAMTSRLPELCERAMQAKRAAGHFSAPYAVERGG